MALNDLTGQNIQDTYKKLVQTEGNTFADGSGSAITTFNVTSSHAVSASYALSASHEITYELSSSHAINADTASFATNFTASGNISSSGNIYSDELYTNGTNLKLYGSTNYQVISSSKQIVYNSVSHHFHPGNFSLPTGNDVFMKIGGDTNIIGNITASGNISASGDLIASSSLTLTAASSKIIGPGNNDYISLGTDNIDIFIDGGEVINVDNNSINLNVSNANIDTSITSDDGTLLFFGDASNNAVRLNNHVIMSPGAPTDYTNRLFVSGSSKFIGNITASGNISSSAFIYADTFNAATEVRTDVIKSKTGTAVGVTLENNVTASGNISASGAVYANQYYSDGHPIVKNQLSGIGNIAYLGFSNTTDGIQIGKGNQSEGVNITGHITASGDISASGDLIVNNINGTINGGTF